MPLAPASEVGEFVEKMAGPALAQRAERIAKIESGSPSARFPEIASSSAPASGSSWPALLVPGTGYPSVTTEVATSSALSPAPPTPLPPGDRSIGAIVSDSLPRPPAGREEEPTFLRLRKRVLRRVVLAAAGLSSAILLVAVGVGLRQRREPAAAQVTTSVVAPGVPPLSSPPAAEPGAPAVAPGADEPPAAALPVASTPAASASSMGGPAPVHGAGVRMVPPHRSAATSCDPPFVIDANGFRHYKRECLR
jgi:eukaryotic-like serine/threonine-protein kinase